MLEFEDFIAPKGDLFAMTMTSEQQSPILLRGLTPHEVSRMVFELAPHLQSHFFVLMKKAKNKSRIITSILKNLVKTGHRRRGGQQRIWYVSTYERVCNIIGTWRFLLVTRVIK